MNKEFRVSGLFAKIVVTTMAMLSIANAPVRAAEVPVLWDTAWLLPMADSTTIDNYLLTRRNQRFDVVMTSITRWSMDNAPLGNGQKAFVDSAQTNSSGKIMADISKPRVEGFLYIDSMIDKATKRGIKIALLPMSNGNSGDYVKALGTTTRAFNYGKFLGTRYATRDIIWVLGGDVANPASNTALPGLTKALADGIRAGGALQPITFHSGFSTTTDGSSTKWFPLDGQWLDFNMLQNRTGIAGLIRKDYNAGKANGKIVGLSEGRYEGFTDSAGVPTDGLSIRRQAYETFLAGGRFVTYGQFAKTATGGTGGACCGGPYTTTNIPGANQSFITKNLMVQRKWTSYVPDESFVTRFAGAKTAAINSNKAAMVYLATSSSSVTINMGRLNASSKVHVQRFNPGKATLAVVGTYNAAGTMTFNTAGLSDAVLLFDSVAAAPGLPDVIVTGLTYSNGAFTATLKNIGTAPTPAGVLVGVSFSVDGITKTTYGSVLAPLAVNASVNITNILTDTSTNMGTVGGPLSIPTGTHTIRATADPSARYPESNESNNAFSKSIAVP